MITEVKDLDKIAPILKKHFHSYIVSNDPFEKVLIYSHEEIMGIISYSIIYERAEINYIITLPNYRRQGIANKLLEEALDDIEKQKCESVSLEVETTNQEAINLYLKYGFQIKADRPNYYEGKKAYLMIKEIEVR